MTVTTTVLLWITPSLAVGTNWPQEDLLDADEATTWIQAGADPRWAVVRDEDTARQVLDNLGLTAEEIEDRLHFAHTGEVLHPPL